MLACIVCMCTVGSYAAWLAGNVVLGAFTLFLMFFIGIRFLVKPDTTREDTAARGERLDARGIAISLFFGLTIGFGTGFVGTGGGMMMLVVFTVFLRMDLKSAVGTSTFIMTFTALIASVSHILIHPAIVTERAGALLICAVTATVFSLGSARFANRVENRTVGLVGIHLGRHVVRWCIADGKKTWEGTYAMFVTALVCGFLIFTVLEGASPATALVACVPISAIAALVELASKDGNDTVWVPLATVVVLSAMMRLLA